MKLNVKLLSYLPAPARRRLYLGLQRAIGSQISNVWQTFTSWEEFSAEQLEEAVERQLSTLLQRATRETTHYRNLGLIRNSGETAKEFLKRFPVLSRNTLRENFPHLVADAWKSQITSPQSISPAGYNWLIVKTGGTTGVPTSVVHDTVTRDWGRATRLYSARQCGFPIGTRYFRLWGSEQDLLKTDATLQARVQQSLLGEIPLNAFRARERELHQHYETLQRYPQVHHLMSYVDAAVSLAMFIKDNQLPRRPLSTIMACAGTVTPEWRQILEDTFSGEVFDKYGSRECCDIACECRFHTGLHVYSPNVFVEIVDHRGHECAPGQTGKILVTLLNNFTFPMIRYEIGDLGIWEQSGPCECKLPFPRIKNIQGRADDMLITEDGTLLSSVFVRHFVGVSLNRELIREWQFEQVGPKQFNFRFIPLHRTGLQENLEKIKASFHLAIGTSVDIKMTEVEEIPPSPTGKIRWIVNNLRR